MFERRLVYRSFEFFFLQAFCIIIEDFVIRIGKQLFLRGGIELKPGGANMSWAGVVLRVVGYCWVTLWFCWSLPIWLDGNSVFGFNNDDIKPIARFMLDTWKRWV